MLNNAMSSLESKTEVCFIDDLKSVDSRYDQRKCGSGRCNGTFGELLQGVLPDQERHFLVTLPITRSATAHFTSLFGSDQIFVFPAHKEKTRRFARRLLQYYGCKSGGVLTLSSELTEGKGCASSSADLVATAYAIQSAFHLSIPSQTLGFLMASIEPSDGVMYPGIVSFYHREGTLRHFLGTLPPLTIIGIDDGGSIDTIAFNQQLGAYKKKEQQEYERLLFQLEASIRRQDIDVLGEIATCSALLNQKRAPKKHLDVLLALREQYRLPGIVVAHSGTYSGLLLNQTSPGYSNALVACLRELERCTLNADIFYTQQF